MLRSIKGQQEPTLVRVPKVMMEHGVLQVLKVPLVPLVLRVDYQHMQYHLVQLFSGLVQQMLFHQVGL